VYLIAVDIYCVYRFIVLKLIMLEIQMMIKSGSAFFFSTRFERHYSIIYYITLQMVFA
jgi:hypothetical protein